jgi:hypothetical protein
MVGGFILDTNEEWCKKIGGMLENVEIIGFLKNFDSFFNSTDTDNDSWIEFIKRWFQEKNEEVVFAKDITHIAISCGLINDKNSNSRSLGKLLSQYKDRIYDGIKLIQVGTNQGIKTWRLKKMINNVC